MVIKYSDPYKDNPYGKLKGNKADAYFKVVFDEGKLHKIDNGYILAAYCTSYDGVVRSFKPDLGIDHGLCEIPFYSSEYEVSRKVNGAYQTEKHQPSIFEKALCKYFDDHIDDWQGNGDVLTGLVGHIPNAMCANFTGELLEQMLLQNVAVKPITPVGLLKPYTPPGSKSYGKSGGSWSKGFSMDDKLAFIKKELCDSIKNGSPTEDESLAELTIRFKNEHAQDEAFLSIYFDMLMAIIR